MGRNGDPQHERFLLNRDHYNVFDVLLNRPAVTTQTVFFGRSNQLVKPTGQEKDEA